MRKRILGTTIVLIWIMMVGWKARDEYFQPELTRLANAAAMSLASARSSARTTGFSFLTRPCGTRRLR